MNVHIVLACGESVGCNVASYMYMYIVRVRVPYFLAGNKYTTGLDLIVSA